MRNIHVHLVTTGGVKMGEGIDAIDESVPSKILLVELSCLHCKRTFGIEENYMVPVNCPYCTRLVED